MMRILLAFRLIPAALLLLLCAGCIKIDLNPPVAEVEEEIVGGSGSAKVALIDISGVLTLGHFGLDRFSKEPPLIPRLREELDQAFSDEKVVALVVRIESPGGSVTASDILYHELLRFKEKKNVPLVVCVMDKALSGGYYAALAADEIYCHPTSVLGGVGVISLRVNLQPLLDKWGVQTEVVKSGPLKDFWSPLRPSRPLEIEIMEEITEGMFDRFLTLVAKNRGLSPEMMETVATGRLFGAEKALKMGLADRIGYLEDALDRARELAGVSEARTVIYRRPGSYAENIYAADAPLLREFSTLEQAASELLMPSYRYQVIP